MLVAQEPMSNAERQRQFRARNPGYNRRYRNRTSDAETLTTLNAAIAAAEAAIAPPNPQDMPPADAVPDYII